MRDSGQKWRAKVAGKTCGEERRFKVILSGLDQRKTSPPPNRIRADSSIIVTFFTTHSPQTISLAVTAKLNHTMADRIRSATLNRDTNETKIQLSINLDGGALEDAAANGEEGKSHAAQASKSQHIDIDSGIGFLDHMLHALAKHAGWSIKLRCRGDLHST